MSKAIKVPVDIRRIPCKIATGEAHPPLSNQNQPLKIGILSTVRRSPKSYLRLSLALSEFIMFFLQKGIEK
ncbi:hypothetical protein RhiirA1_409262 [Rhizophagus irregularis]|uniref:Uncharacterized protein n=1 Tax=Rhizophagus irregularis TaxID=588596 RepID=A0A2N0SFV2_9GLOM|nr:hypothetical protein RhiirA1_409262 [Rhizophagus irregularis]